MSRELRDQVVVITGGAEGIGFHAAEEFIKYDLKALIILDINENFGKQSVEELNKKCRGKAEFIKCDVTKDLDTVFMQIIAKYKTVDVLVNNAGICNENELRKTMEINAIAVMEWSMKFWEHMRKDKGGKGGTILNMASIYGYYVDPYLPFYKASKYAVMGFTKTLGYESNFKKFGVRLVALCPGFTRTRLSYEIEAPFLKEELLEHMKTVTWQDAEDVGKSVVEVFKQGDSGTAWKIEGGDHIEQVL